jgi:hypothetical protein
VHDDKSAREGVRTLHSLHNLVLGRWRGNEAVLTMENDVWDAAPL